MKREHFHLFFILNTSNEIIPIMRGCTQETVPVELIHPKSSLHIWYEKFCNEITRKISSCFMKNYWKKASLNQKKLKKRKNCLERRARDDRNLSR